MPFLPPRHSAPTQARARVRRVVLGAMALGLLGGQPAQAQGVDALQQYASKILTGCKYEEYIKKADEVAGAIGNARNLGSAINTVMKGPSWLSAPTVDLLTWVGLKGNEAAAKMQLDQEKRGLVMQMEQACQTWLMAKTVERQYRLAKAANFNIDKVLGFAARDLGVHFTPGATDKTLVDITKRTFAQSHRSADNHAGLSNAIAGTSINAMENASELSQYASSTLDYTDELAKQMNEYAEFKDGQWTCVGEPVTEAVLASLNIGKPISPGVELICGPASPGKMDLLRGQMKAAQIRTDAALALAKAQELKVNAADVTNRIVTEREGRQAHAVAMHGMVF
jgi:hypothetical protein